MGRHITHLFSEMDIILQPDWQLRRTEIQLQLANLRVFRPATIDLILTKMARGDEQDLEDIQFLLNREPLSPQKLREAFARARVPDVEEFASFFSPPSPKSSAWRRSPRDNCLVLNETS